MILPTILGGLLRHTRTMFKTREVVPNTPYKTKGKQISDALDQLEKGQAAAIFNLRCVHYPLRKFLYQFGVEEHNRCTTCFAMETPACFIASVLQEIHKTTKKI